MHALQSEALCFIHPQVNGISVPATGGSITPSGVPYTMFYSYVVPSTSTGPYTISMPTATGCPPGGSWIPSSSRTVPSAPAAGQDFTFLLGKAIPMDLIALSMQGFMQSAQLHLNNYNGNGGSLQTSYFLLNSIKTSLTIPVVSFSLGWGGVLGQGTCISSAALI